MNLKHRGYSGVLVDDVVPFVRIDGIADYCIEPAGADPEAAFRVLVNDYISTLSELAWRPRGQKRDPLRRYADGERTGAVCYDCRRDYGTFPDLLISDDVWEQINPTHHRGCGLLCPTCIAARITAAGLSDVPAAFVSSPLVSGVVLSRPGDPIEVVAAQSYLAGEKDVA